MTRKSNHADFIVRVIGKTIPVKEGTKRHAGFVALRDYDGETYGAFRDLVGPRPEGNDDRPFSPSTVIGLAQRYGFARLEPPRLDRTATGDTSA